ncbi:hypothetical protein AJ80_02571 [Polytolypa hystricis UAMH7299]|uniref:F-box domain-containing protein n=1 Tax=Polytolypa hystricis (strain UAMH7299) TaxID=1447883 RepID=A0A2B7YQL1_POLH7|nr:hypothetical protein AJ80_02571 [Polytolypa hystricis UAMH7299]
MSAVASSRPSESVRMPFHHDPYHEVEPRRQRQRPPVYPHHTSIDRPTSPRSPTLPYMPQYAGPPSPTIYSPTSPTSPSFSFRAFKPVPPSSIALQQQQQQRSQCVFRCLPQEVYDCILTYLQLSHCPPSLEGCMTCYMRDLYSLSLSSRAWEKAVRGKLYNKIYIQGNDPPAQLKKYKWKRGSRLRLLRRTLRERKTLANAVFELRVPELDVSLVSNAKQSAVLQEYRDLIASVVMVCPNLEHLLGFSLPYNHEFDRLTHALSTRKKLKEHAWIIGQNVEVAERSKHQPSGLLDQIQVFQFLNFHTSWSNLETLVLHSLDSKGVMEHGVFLRMFNFLTSLRHLSVSCFDGEDFTDRTLLFLPPLVSLRLDSLRGVSEQGLARYTSRPEAQNIESLTLIEQNVTSLLVVSKILASLTHLERFSMVQVTTALTLPDEGMVFQPLLASSNLKHLHWDIASLNPGAALNKLDSTPSLKDLRNFNTANSHLAQSILNAGFPQLQTLRAPLDIDPLGALQSVCRPTRHGQIMLHSDRYSLPRSSHGSMPKRPLALPGGNNLTSARIRAQTLIDMPPKDNDSGIKVLITDHSALNGVPQFPTEGPAPPKKKKSIPTPKTLSAITVHEFVLPGCIGRVGRSAATRSNPSIPHFTLSPDISGFDADGGLVSWRHILASNQTFLFASPSLTLSVDRVSTGSTTMSDDIPSPSPTSATPSSRFSSWGSNTSTASSGPGPGIGGGLTLNTKSLGGIGGGPLSAPSPRSPTSPTSPSMTTMMGHYSQFSPSALPTPTTTSGAGGNNNSSRPFWARDACNGSWNQRHNSKSGKDWWMHVERERLGVDDWTENARLVQLF